MNENIYLLWLSSIEGVSVKRKRLLMDIYGSAYNIWTQPLSAIKEIKGITPQIIEKIKMSKDENRLKNYIKELKNRNIIFIGINDRRYPELLRNIYDPPLGLYVRGEIPLDYINVSIIGTRRCSEYGSSVAERIAKELARLGVVVVSGMASGIDSCAHRGALLGGGKTIAVLGCGIDVCYPPQNRELMEEIVNNGCVVTEYPLGTEPFPSNFPERNRIISGLSAGTVVVEATMHSGTSHTVNQALEQGRDVMAVPGNITSSQSIGTNDLIKSGAALVSCAQDILDVLNVSSTIDINTPSSEYIKIENLANDEKTVYDCINFEPIYVDGIVYKTSFSIQAVQYALTKLTIKQLIKQLPGQRYIRS